MEFEIVLEDKRVACCWQADKQEYADMTLSAGLVEGIEPDTIYFRYEREGEEPTTVFMRPDEAQATARLLNGALWSASMLDLARLQDRVENL